MKLHPYRAVALVALTLVVALSGCRSLLKRFVDARGYRYCEILLQYDDTAEIWGTQPLNRCPADKWEALDPEAIRAAYDATDIHMNGPRYFVINGGSGMDLSDADTRLYGDLEMVKLATLAAAEPAPYTPLPVLRSNVWQFKRGGEIYELTDPEGHVYVMQSYSQIIDSDLQESDLSSLGMRLDLPTGWSFSSRLLDENLELTAGGEAIVVQDNLRNTYQRR